jgi:hypothetical protein
MKSLVEFYEFVLSEDVQTNTQFNLRVLKNTSELDQIHSYLEKTLGSPFEGGASRSVWSFDENKIIKTVNYQDDAHQNKLEIENSKCLGEKFSPIVFDYDKENFYWIISEKVTPGYDELIFNKVNEKLGIRFDNWMTFKNFFDLSVRRTKPLYNQQFEEFFVSSYKNSKWFKSLIDGLRSCKVASWDFHPNNWGIRPSTSELVLIDLGAGDEE